MCQGTVQGTGDNNAEQLCADGVPGIAGAWLTQLTLSAAPRDGSTLGPSHTLEKSKS